MSEKFWSLIESIAMWCLKLLYRMIGKEFTEESAKAWMQFVKFGVVGVSNTLVSYLIYIATLLGMGYFGMLPDYDYVVANVVSFVLSVLWSFYWNNKYVFKKDEGEERSLLKTLFKTYCSYAFTGLFLNNVLSILWVQLFHCPKEIAPVFNLVISVPINFVLNKIWAYGK